MDCFKSGLEGTAEPVGVDEELDDLADRPEGGPPKKSRPSNESAAFVCLGGAEALGGGGRAPAVSVVFGLAGGSGTSPNKSTAGAAFRGGGSGWLDVDETRCEEPRSSLAFSWTTFSGYPWFSIRSCRWKKGGCTISSSPSASNVAGSGIGPSITHRLDSYFVRMKFSILLKAVQHLLASSGAWRLIPVRWHMSRGQL